MWNLFANYKTKLWRKHNEEVYLEYAPLVQKRHKKQSNNQWRLLSCKRKQLKIENTETIWAKYIYWNFEIIMPITRSGKSLGHLSPIETPVMGDLMEWISRHVTAWAMLTLKLQIWIWICWQITILKLAQEKFYLKLIKLKNYTLLWNIS